MSKIDTIKKTHSEKLELQCKKHHVSIISVEKLLEAEKTKKLLKRNALIQQTIDKEIENSLDNEN